MRRSLSRRKSASPQATEGNAAARSAKASGKGAARCANGGQHSRTGPVWRASGPLVSEAFRLVNSVEETLSQLVSRGYPLELAAHRLAAASAGAAVYHTIGAGHTLLHARELCDEGGWLRWLRKNFDGSVRTAQRYMRVARRVPANKINATSVSPKSQAAVLRAIRGAVFTGSGDTVAGAPCVGDPTAACDAGAAAHRRLAFVAARRLRKLASSLVATAAGGRAAGARAAEFAERINALATDFLLDVGGASTSGEVYFIEAVGAARVKIGVSGDVDKRFGQLAASFSGPLRFLGKAPGGRAREGSLHRRLANFHMGGEWFHLTPGVRSSKR